MVRSALLGILVLAATGCSHVDITKTAKGYFEPTDPAQVEVLKLPPDRKYTELGAVTSTDFRVDEVAKMHNVMRTEAAKLGANAVVITDEGIIPGGMFTAGKRWATGVAVRFE